MNILNLYLLQINRHTKIKFHLGPAKQLSINGEKKKKKEKNINSSIDLIRNFFIYS